ncbi:hypothetical protein TTRE_0000792101 [Trichuris trichiura]|uniref:Uncharacterized protein n=1 Tax=Trichuris trichiura TaxID=36087 RepID=A0A077ZIG5_TRITR|nr:hypothetical protein TTRE_0000792101 [Trichuris trichiura]
MSATSVSCEDILNFPMRKLFCCELSYVRFDGALNSWTIRVDGKTFQVYLVWLQGSLSVFSDDDQTSPSATNVFFTDMTGSVRVIIPYVLKNAVSNLPAENYCSMICEVVDVESAGTNVTVKAKRLAPLNPADKERLEEAWAVEVEKYHCWLGSTKGVGE